MENVKVFPIALAEERGYSYFDFAENSSMGKLKNEEHQFIVYKDLVDRLVTEEIVLPPNIVKIDVEGAELKVLIGMSKTIDYFKPIIFVAIDDPCNKDAIFELFFDKNYIVHDLDKIGKEILAVPK
ncbi:MAG: FkbM family methyltransferase [Thermoplasmata archaeon]